jgi:hypothetical protein
LLVSLFADADADADAVTDADTEVIFKSIKSIFMYVIYIYEIEFKSIS